MESKKASHDHVRMHIYVLRYYISSIILVVCCVLYIFVRNYERTNCNIATDAHYYDNARFISSFYLCMLLSLVALPLLVTLPPCPQPSSMITPSSRLYVTYILHTKQLCNYVVFATCTTISTF